MLKHHDAKFFESLNVLFIDLTFYFFQILMIEEKKLRSSSYLKHVTQNWPRTQGRSDFGIVLTLPLFISIYRLEKNPILI